MSKKIIGYEAVSLNAEGKKVKEIKRIFLSKEINVTHQSAKKDAKQAADDYAVVNKERLARWKQTVGVLPIKEFKD